MSVLTFSCLKKQSIFSSRNTRLDDIRDWNTLGSFFNATRLPSLGSVTALFIGIKLCIHVLSIIVRNQHKLD